jgi:hypothetical protein
VATRGVHEELERVECAGRAGRRLRAHLGAHDDVALLERGPERSKLLLGELVLVGEGLDLLLLDEAAVGGLLDQALGRREVMQMNRVAQWNTLSVVVGRSGCGLLASGPQVNPQETGSAM